MEICSAVRSGGHRLTVLALLLLCLNTVASLCLAENLSADAQKRVLASTFEVVQLKPEEGAVTYERELPMDLIPYQQRIDKYRSIGTAFAVGPNRFVTAAHVVAAGMNSQFGPPALRNAKGDVFSIDRVIKYSDSADFVEFSLQHAPGDLQTLPIGAPIPVNDPVFAVGNALGQGIVVRDGVYTSDTPEEEQGRWNWLRFTAAASPGNSGGPLIDKDGKVIGVVLRKSQSENLNYAAPIKLVVDASETEGVVDSRANVRLPIMEATENFQVHDTFTLPAQLADVYTALMKITAAYISRGDAQLFDHNKERLFPQSASSAELLTQTMRTPFPRRIQERQDRVWIAAIPKDVQAAQLDHNGTVYYGNNLYRLHAPDDVKLAALYGDSKLFMDLLLKSAFNLKRQIGSESIKVTSLGKARQEFTTTDSYGRVWQRKVWAVPFDDAYVVTMSLPTPEGIVTVLVGGPSSIKDALLNQQAVMTNFMWVTYEGTLSRWQEFLALKAVQPQIFSKLTVDIDPAYKRVHFRSPRYELTVTPDFQPLTADSMLSLNFSFFRDVGTVVWDVGGVSVTESAQKINFVAVRRMSRPDPALPTSFQSTWAKLLAGEFPYDAVATDVTGGMRISMPADITVTSDQAAIRYVLEAQNEGSPGQDPMHARLEGLHKAFKALEH